MQHDHIKKKINFGLDPTPLVHPRGSDPGIQTKIPLNMLHVYCCSACMQNCSKILTTAYIVITKFKYLTNQLRCDQREWGKIWTLPCLATCTEQSWSIVKSC